VILFSKNEKKLKIPPFLALQMLEQMNR